MLTFDNIRVGSLVQGGAWHVPVSIVHVDRISDAAAEVTWRANDGRLGTSVLFPSDLSSLKLAEVGRPFAFTGDGSLYQLAMEA
jgi:hypothetical protein